MKNKNDQSQSSSNGKTKRESSHRLHSPRCQLPEAVDRKDDKQPSSHRAKRHKTNRRYLIFATGRREEIRQSTPYSSAQNARSKRVWYSCRKVMDNMLYQLNSGCRASQTSPATSSYDVVRDSYLVSGFNEFAFQRLCAKSVCFLWCSLFRRATDNTRSSSLVQRDGGRYVWAFFLRPYRRS